MADPHHYGNLRVYPKPDQEIEVKAPSGYSVAFVESLNRHGARTLTKEDTARDALRLWKKARDAGALTSTGRRLEPAVRRLETAMRKVGYGNISGRGAKELRQLGEREIARYADYFGRAAAADDSVAVIDSGYTRAIESGDNFVKGLKGAEPQLRVKDSQSDEKLLHFDTEDREYKKFLEDGQAWKALYRRAMAPQNLTGKAQTALRVLYTPDFVAKIPNPVTQVDYLYDLYRIAPNMAQEVSVDMTPFLADSAAAALAFNDDARYFYSRGPGATGTDDAYKAADVLLDDFVNEAQDRLDGGTTAAVYRFAHAEEVTPFAALLGLPGSEQLPQGKIFSYATSDFRLASVAPVAANIHWTVWASKSSGPALVSVRANELPSSLASTCAPVKGTPGFYKLADLKTCLHR